MAGRWAPDLHVSSDGLTESPRPEILRGWASGPRTPVKGPLGSARTSQDSDITSSPTTAPGALPPRAPSTHTPLVPVKGRGAPRVSKVPMARPADLHALSELRREEVSLTNIQARRAGQPRVLKKLTKRTEDFLKEVILTSTADIGGVALSPDMIQAAMQSRAPASWEKYTGIFRLWENYATARAKPRLPIDPLVFAAFLAAEGKKDKRTNRTPSRIAAADALSGISGHPLPGLHAQVRICRKAANRKRHPPPRRAPPIFLAEVPQPSQARSAHPPHDSF